MKSKLYITVITSVFAALLLSCGESENARILREADEIIETDPSKSLEILSQAQREDFSAADSAYYALLYTQAQVKSGVRVLSDTLISVAYDYYKDRNEGDLSERAYFYRGMTFYDSHNYREAMKDMLAAYDLADNNNHPYWKAKSAEIISDMFSNLYNYRQAEQYSLSAVNNYKISKRTSNHRYALCDLSCIYLNEFRSEEAYNILDSLHNVLLREHPRDPNLLYYLYIPYVSSLIATDRIGEIKPEYFPPLREDASNQEIIDRIILLSKISRGNNDFLSANQSLNEAARIATSDAQAYDVLFQIYLLNRQQQDYEKAFISADSLLRLQSKVVRGIMDESISGVKSDFYHSRATESTQRSKQLSFQLTLVIAVAVLLMVLLITIYQLHIRKKKAELESVMTSVLYLKEQADNFSARNSKLSEQLRKNSVTISDLRKELDSKTGDDTRNALIMENLFKEKWATLNMLCNQYYEKGDSEAAQKDILHNIEKELKKLRTPKKLKEIEEATDLYMDGIITRLRHQCPFLKESDITFLSLVVAGFSVRAVCLFLDIKYKFFYLKKTRLAERIANSEAKDKEIFLRHLS